MKVILEYGTRMIVDTAMIVDGGSKSAAVGITRPPRKRQGLGDL